MSYLRKVQIQRLLPEICKSWTTVWLMKHQKEFTKHLDMLDMCS